jgi:DeoR family transcriptional regulator, fructose operon transcriptional repressor
MSEPLFVEERRRTILDYLKEHGRVSVKSLSEVFNVSTVTIRQDLRALQNDGLLERTYGGAVARASGSNIPEQAFHIRRRSQHAEKDAIGRAAASLVQNGWGIALDSSSTAFAIIPYLRHLADLTIVTYSLMIAQQFLESPNIQVILPGGKLRVESIALVGRPDTMPNINLKTGFFGARGVALDAGITEATREEAEMKQALITCCRQIVVVADSTKWGQIAPYTFIAAVNVDRFITTNKTHPEQVSQFHSAGFSVDVIAISNR